MTDTEPKFSKAVIIKEIDNTPRAVHLSVTEDGATFVDMGNLLVDPTNEEADDWAKFRAETFAAYAKDPHIPQGRPKKNGS